MIKAILIDGYGQCVKQMHIRPSFHDVEEVIGPFWYLSKPILLDNGDKIFHDSRNDEHCASAPEFTYQGSWYRGNVLIARVDTYGDLIDCRTELASVRPCVVWK